MNEVWKQWEGQTAGGRLPLRKYLGESERGPVFLTEYGAEENKAAAIKLIPADPQTADAQLARWALAANLTHPHLLRIFETGRCELSGARLLYAVMEYADEDLSHVIPERSLTPAETREMLRPVLETLAYLHGKELVHGHIKPANIMAVGEELRISSDGVSAARETRGRGKATAYEAPEAGTRGGSAAGDVWSLGVTLVEVLTQQLPVWEWKGQEEPLLPAAPPAPFGDIAKQCLRRDPQRRCTLAEIATRLDPEAPPLVVQPRAEPRAKAKPVAAAKSPQTVKPPAETKPKVEAPTPKATTQRASPKRSYAIPAIAIGVAALVAIFVAPKLLNRSPEASPGPTAGTPAATALQSSKSEQALPHGPATDQTAHSSETLVAKGTDSGGPEPPPAAPVDPPAAKPAARKSGGDSVPGGVVRQVLPQVPERARETIQGTVRVGVRVQVDPTGKVAEANLDSAGPSKYFSNLALKAARDWEFTPAIVGGENAPSEWILKFYFAQDGAKVTPAQLAR
jgi:eukaryotic-like serine/threonine-protein kinase